MYTATATRLDITFATSILSQFAQAPAKVHWEASKQVVRYLKATCDLEITYGTGHANIVGYLDADHTSQLHWHSMSGYSFLLGGGVVMWSSKKTTHHCIVYDGGQIHLGHTCYKGGNVATHLHGGDHHITLHNNHNSLQQPICDITVQRWTVPHME